MLFFTSYRVSIISPNNIIAPNNIVAPNNFRDISDGTSNTLVLAR